MIVEILTVHQSCFCILVAHITYSLLNYIVIYYLSKLQEMVKDGEDWPATVHGVTKSQTILGVHARKHHTQGRPGEGTGRKRPYASQGEEPQKKPTCCTLTLNFSCRNCEKINFRFFF